MNIGEVFYLASGLVFIAIGIALVTTRRRDPPAIALAVYVLGLGVLYASSALGGRHPTLQVLLGFVAAAGLGAFAVLFPKRLSGKGWFDAALCAACGMGFVLFLGWINLRAETSGFREMLGVTGLEFVLMLVSFNIIAIVSVAAMLLLPLRARRLGAAEGGAMRTLGMLAVAYLLVTPGGPFTAIVAAARGEVPFAHGFVVFLISVLSLVLWLPSTAGPQARAARNIILALVSLTLGLGALHHVVGDLVIPIGRLLSALFLAYAVVAGQIEGLDLKVRWGISRSTIAAAFVAVFFVASEGAQIVFGSGNEWVGLVVAGALVFAVAPLQRAAERLAEKAVPASIDSLQMQAATDAQEAAYKAAVRLALRGGISREEEIDLARIAEAHALSPLRALQLRQEVEDSHASEAAT